MERVAARERERAREYDNLIYPFLLITFFSCFSCPLPCLPAPHSHHPHRTDDYRVAGTLIGAVGGSAWDPTCDVGLLRATLRPNMLSLRLRNVPAGSYEYKVELGDGSGWAVR